MQVGKPESRAEIELDFLNYMSFVIRFFKLEKIKKKKPIKQRLPKQSNKTALLFYEGVLTL